MYKGTISPSTDNSFKYNISTKDLPFNLISPIKNEAYYTSYNGKKKIIINIESENDILFLKSSSLNLTIEIDKIKIKATLKDVIINKIDNGYEMSFSSIYI